MSMFCLFVAAAYKHADGKKIDGRRIVVDVERGRTVKTWKPRRLGEFSLCCKNIDMFITGVESRGGGALPDKGLMETCGQPGYVFRDFCLKQGMVS